LDPEREHGEEALHIEERSVASSRTPEHEAIWPNFQNQF